MRLRTILILILFHSPSTVAQINTFPYSENFDSVLAPRFPAGWSASGFVDTASTARSLPNCILAKGNTVVKMLTSSEFDFTNRVPDKLVYYEYRSNTAKYFRLEIRISTNGIDFNTVSCNLIRLHRCQITCSVLLIFPDLDYSSNRTSESAGNYLAIIQTQPVFSESMILRSKLQMDMMSGFPISLVAPVQCNTERFNNAFNDSKKLWII